MYEPAADRYQKMPYRRCGTAGIVLPAITLGCWHNFGAAGTGSNQLTDEAAWHENCRAMLTTAFDLGINHFDLANNYGPPPGSAEERVGRLLKEFPRDELLISSKAGYWMWPGPYGEGSSRKYLLSSLDQSLKRLQLDYVDIFYSHRFDSNTPLEETMGALDTAIRQGKALYGGISSYGPGETADAIRVCEQRGFIKPVIHQPVYSMLNRWIEPGLLSVTKRLGLGIIAFSPLAQGLLTGKYLDGTIPIDSRAASEHGALSAENVTPNLVAKLNKLNEIAKGRGQSLAQMTLAWTIRDSGVTSALIGASRPEQLRENAAAMQNAAFSDEEKKAIDEALR